jgi:replicative DNA helicase
MAYQLSLPIVVGSMMNRGIDYREGLMGREPQLKDLAFSSYIEGLADVVMMVYRPEYYQIYQDDDGRDMHGVMQIFVKKNGPRPQGCEYLSYQQDTGIVSLVEDTKSKPVSLEEFGADNETVKSLVKTFDLEEVLPL